MNNNMDKIRKIHFHVRIIGIILALSLVSISDYQKHIILLAGIGFLYAIIAFIAVLDIFPNKLNMDYNMIYLDVALLSIAIAVRGGIRSDFYLGYIIIFSYVLLCMKWKDLLILTCWTVICYSIVIIWTSSNLEHDLRRLIIRLGMILAISLLLQNYARILFKSEVRRKSAMEASIFDELTGLYNRRALKMAEKFLLEENDKAYIVLIDLDNFKKVNDEYGHINGDEVLKVISDIIKRRIKSTEYGIRYGGEELIIISFASSKNILKHKLQLIQNDLKEHHFSWLESEKRITFTAGVVLWKKNEAVEQVIENADKALYMGKENGKDQIIFISDTENCQL
ncbi:hypothetical protein SH2C18_19160 [Clostridium sediminicola]|uniref:GGDEF domain-containing protein n=1 Tax=Clostridium sediminicola TaxID=3114879 RepID=UPI0031F242CB